ncbi:MAG: PDZ domain-containing protein [Ignavibacteriae bacterium]|nr:PDZ domain-containing protein [Ignavibacteriota bacterium]
MKVRLILLLTLLLSIGVVTSYGCLPGENGFHFIKDKKSKQGYLGVNIEDVTRRLAERKNLKTTSGAYVSSVVDNSAAEDAGIEKGDVIVKYNGKEVEDSDELTSLVRKTKPGTSVDILVERDGENKTLKAEIDRLKDSDFSFFNFDDEDFHVRVPDPPRVNVRPRIQVFGNQSQMHGLVVQSISKQLAEYFEVPGKKGALVTEVKKSSDAEKAGLKAGDVVTKVGSVNVWDADDLMEELNDADEGDELSLEVIRKGKLSTMKMKISETEDEDDWSFHVAPDAKGYHYYYNNDNFKNEHKRVMKEVGKELHESLKDAEREVKKAKETIRKELYRL